MRLRKKEREKGREAADEGEQEEKISRPKLLDNGWRVGLLGCNKDKDIYRVAPVTVRDKDTRNVNCPQRISFSTRTNENEKSQFPYITIFSKSMSLFSTCSPK
jgi:hypothetical protein